jgi:uncharacterized protein YkwD
MSKLRIPLFILAIVGLIYAAAAGYFTPQPTPEGIADDVVARINAARASRGIPPLTVNEHLVWMAQARSDDMVQGDYYSHDPPPGHPTLNDLLEELGYQRGFPPVENLVSVPLFMGRLDGVARRSVDAWYDSRGHWLWAMDEYANITGVGVAVGDGYVVITQLFWGGDIFTPRAVYQHNR